MCESCLLCGNVDGCLPAGADTPHRDRCDAHDTAVAGTASTGGVVTAAGSAHVVLVGQSGARGDADVGCRERPRPEVLPHVRRVVAAAAQQGLGQRKGHLGVVGELTGSPGEPAATDHLAAAFQDGHGERGQVLTGGSELEWCTHCVGDGGAHDGSDGPELLFDGEAGGNVCNAEAVVGHGSPLS